MSEKAPWYARMIGVPLVLFAVSNGIGFVLLARDQLGSSRDIALNVVGSLVAITAGVGLLMSRRGGWGLAFAATLVILPVPRPPEFSRTWREWRRSALRSAAAW